MHWAKVLVYRPGYRSERARAQAVGQWSAICPQMDHRAKWRGVKPLKPDIPFGSSCSDHLIYTGVYLSSYLIHRSQSIEISFHCIQYKQAKLYICIDFMDAQKQSIKDISGY